MEKYFDEQINNKCSDSKIISEIELDFEQNLIGENTSNCEDYGCTCINHEKCCGCVLQ